MSMTNYSVVVVGTDGSSLAEPTVSRAAWMARNEDADLVIVCAYSRLSSRAEAKNVATLGGDPRGGEVLGRAAANEALIDTVKKHRAEVLVLGARSDVSFAERLLGTLAREIVDRAFCDILIVRPNEPGDIPVPEDAGA